MSRLINFPKHELVDPYGRVIKYLRLSVTDRCDLRCNYCMPKGFNGFDVPKEWLTFEEIERIARAFANLGVSHIRITGGEPLLRKDLVSLVSRIAILPGISDISLSTNATQLAKHAESLKSAGLKRLNVSLDSLDTERFFNITGSNSLNEVLLGLSVAKQVGLTPIKINTVVMRDTHDKDIQSLVEYCIAQGFILRFIEVMPMGNTGQGMGWVDLRRIHDMIRTRYGLVEANSEDNKGPARYLTSSNKKVSIGFITPMSQHFCESCNRVRLSVTGTLYLCLGQENKVELGTLLRAGATDMELQQAINQAITMKPERHDFLDSPQKIIRIMAKTGG